MNAWKPIDRQADWLRNQVDAEWQLRIGVLLTWISVPFYPYIAIADEPPAVLFLSVLAATLGGLSLVIGAQVLVNQEGDSHCDGCSCEDETSGDPGW